MDSNPSKLETPIQVDQSQPISSKSDVNNLEFKISPLFHLK